MAPTSCGVPSIRGSLVLSAGSFQFPISCSLATAPAPEPASRCAPPFFPSAALHRAFPLCFRANARLLHADCPRPQPNMGLHPTGLNIPVRWADRQMSDSKLILFPADASAAPNATVLASTLVSAGLLGGPVQVFGEQHFSRGPRFQNLIRSLKPHTAIILGSGMRDEARVDSLTLCTVAFDGPSADTRFLGAANTETPTCTGCGTPLEKWPDAVSEWYSNPSAFSLTCSGCGSVGQLWDLNWHRTNAFARFGIDFWHVHPGQAVPTPELLELLRRVTDHPGTTSSTACNGSCDSRRGRDEWLNRGTLGGPACCESLGCTLRPIGVYVDAWHACRSTFPTRCTSSSTPRICLFGAPSARGRGRAAQARAARGDRSLPCRPHRRGPGALRKGAGTHPSGSSPRVTHARKAG